MAPTDFTFADVEQYDRIVKARVALVDEFPFWGVPAIQLKLAEKFDIETGQTDGKTLWYNPEFVRTLTADEVKGFIAHEVSHPACFHHTRRGGRDAAEWNASTDLSINPRLIKAGLKLPKGALVDDRFAGWSAEQIYQTRASERRQGQGQGQQQPQPGQGQPSGQNPQPGQPGGQPQGGSQPGGAQQPGQNPPASGPQNGSTGSGTGQPGQPGQNGPQTDPNGAQSGQQGAGQDIDPGKCGGVIDAPVIEGETVESSIADAEAEWQAKLGQAMAMAEGFGKMPGWLKEEIEAERKSRVDWREELRRFMQSTVKHDQTWSLPNRRTIASGIYLPRPISDRPRKLVIALDASGSTMMERGSFLGETSDVLDDVRPDEIHLVHFDTRVSHVDELTPGDLPIPNVVHGGGGTDFRPIFEYVEKHDIDPQAVIVLTDLDGPFPKTEPDYPVLWVSTRGSRAPFGEVIQMKDGGAS